MSNTNNDNGFEEENNINDVKVETLENLDNIEDFRKTYDQLFLDKPKITIPFLTKYEKARIIGKRAMQLSKGSPPLVDVSGIENPVDIAIKELKERKIPFIIRRPLPNGSYEDWRLEELRILE